MLDFVGNTRSQLLMRDQFDYPKHPRPAGSGAHPIRLRAASTMRGLAGLLADTADHLDQAGEPAGGEDADYAAFSSASSGSSPSSPSSPS